MFCSKFNVYFLIAGTVRSNSNGESGSAAATSGTNSEVSASVTTAAAGAVAVAETSGNVRGCGVMMMTSDQQGVTESAAENHYNNKVVSKGVSVQYFDFLGLGPAAA